MDAEDTPTPAVPQLPAGVVLAQIEGARGPIGMRVSPRPFGGVGELFDAPGARLVAVVHGSHGMLRQLVAQLEDVRRDGPGAWFTAAGALRALKAQWRAGNVAWLDSVDTETCARIIDACRRDPSRALIGDPPKAPWAQRTKRRGTPRPRPVPELPDHLKARLPGIVEVLRRVHTARGGLAVTEAAVASAMLAQPERDHLAAAHAMEHWLLHGKGQGKPGTDHVARYRRFLESADPIAHAAAAPAADVLRQERMEAARRAAGERGLRVVGA